MELLPRWPHLRVYVALHLPQAHPLPCQPPNHSIPLQLPVMMPRGVSMSYVLCPMFYVYALSASLAWTGEIEEAAVVGCGGVSAIREGHRATPLSPLVFASCHGNATTRAQTNHPLNRTGETRAGVVVWEDHQLRHSRKGVNMSTPLECRRKGGRWMEP